MPPNEPSRVSPQAVPDGQATSNPPDLRVPGTYGSCHEKTAGNHGDMDDEAVFRDTAVPATGLTKLNPVARRPFRKDPGRRRQWSRATR